MPITENSLEQVQPGIQPHVFVETRRLKYWTWWMPLFVLAWAVIFFSVFSEPALLIQRNWPLFLVGFVGAIIGNATAVGGGLIFIPAMIFIYHLPPVAALKLALASQCFGMTSGAIGWARRGVVPGHVLWDLVPALLIGSTISSLIIQPNALLVKGLFGPVSILIGFITLYLLKHRSDRDDIPIKARWPLAGIALIGGMLTGWVAIGEGEVVAAFLMLAYGLKAERGIGLGVVLLSINSIYLTLLHQFVWGGIPWEMVFFTGFGCVFGGRLGPYLSQWVGTNRLKIGFATVAIIDGCIFVFQFLMSGGR